LWYLAVCPSRAVCAVCGASGTRSRLQAHHVIDKSWLRKVARSLKLDQAEAARLVYDVRNGMPLCEVCHSRHELAVARIDRRKVPLAAFGFAGMVNGMLGTEEALVRLEREYPL
jgi:hypothetical protein